MSKFHSVRPEDILPDGADTAILNGKIIRKGTIAAFLANIDILENSNSTECQRLAAIHTMNELAPTVIVIGLHKHVVFKNIEAEKILIQANEDYI